MAENSTKGNPAYHRMSNKALKERRQSSWSRGKRRKEARRQAQKAAEKTNIALVDSEKLTPWQEAQAKRKARRDQDPRVAKARRIHLANALSNQPTNVDQGR